MKKADIILIGGGIMSATLGVLLSKLRPGLHIEVFERLDDVALESSDAWNNAGTGHSAFCELNYTPQLPDGSISIQKAIAIAESFEISKQFWAHLVEEEILHTPKEFISSVAHMSFVHTQDGVAMLKKKHEAVIKNSLFADMEYSESAADLEKWIPLMMQGRSSSSNVAATRMALGTDVNFGTITKQLFAHLTTSGGALLHTGHEVIGIKKQGSEGWEVSVKNTKTNEETAYVADFVFIGAGGAALTLLEKSGITEGKGYGGFPVNGNFLVCTNEEIISRHHAKVYGMPSVGTPPMSVPHLDTRMINGKKELFFGPFAGFSTKFLKHGSYFDLFSSLRPSNILPMLSAGAQNISLTTYLIGQLMLTPRERITHLQEFFPEAKLTEWKFHTAGQRVQIIKHIPGKGGVLQFGTEVVSTTDGSLAVLLGASPGASVSVSIMLELLEKCFPKQLQTSSWKKKLTQMIPTYGKHLAEDEKLCKEIRSYTSRALYLQG